MSVRMKEEPRGRRLVPRNRPQPRAAETETERQLEQLTNRAVDGFEEWVNNLRKQVCSGS
ncbi:MAG: hypothetical protein JXB13_07430 [Phycisphaerae bacterium]|nr:hypothetical protein [Phycisphaerae bacterium]